MKGCAVSALWMKTVRGGVCGATFSASFDITTRRKLDITEACKLLRSSMKTPFGWKLSQKTKPRRVCSARLSRKILHDRDDVAYCLTCVISSDALLYEVSDGRLFHPLRTLRMENAIRKSVGNARSCKASRSLLLTEPEAARRAEKWKSGRQVCSHGIV